MFKTGISIVFILLLSACNSNTVVSESESVPDAWDKDKAIEFTIPKLDSLKKYNVYLHLRNTNDYQFNNIFLIVTMNFPMGKTIVDTLEYRMANADGSWLGKGISSVKESKLWYKENVSFFEDGNYNISITQAVRNNGDVDGVKNLKGIVDIGFSIEEVR